MAELFLGETVDPATHARSGTRIALDPATFTTHGVIVGQTGSGKTGLGIDLIEETLTAGIPTLVIDPKGDLSNLLLMFPDMRAEDFAPWVEGSDPAATAQQWKDGLAGWSIDGARIKALKDSAAFTVYTPGSNAGVPLSLTGSLKAPKLAADDTEGRSDEVEALVSGLLGLMGIESDPLSGRENILMTNLVDRAWAAGQDLDMGTLVAQVQSPPVRKLGVLELDTFYPPADRMQLALKLNGLLASPSFAAWGQGLPVDIASMLHDAAGRPRCAIVSIAHLGDEERQFAVAVLLGKLVTWMRQQPGTSQLRALVYFDEVFGFVPPSAMPPSKKPILTLLKQARAFGVGVVLATQNPVDVDYKALSNAATWMIGRLQTERDRDRLLDGMKSAAGTTDVDALGSIISGLAKREFVLHRSGAPVPSVFTTRWTMSYLRGPLTREQIASLTANAPERASATSMATTPTLTTATPTSSTASAAPAATAVSSPARVLGADEVPIAPAVARGTSAYFLDPGAPWVDTVRADPSSAHHVAGIVARVALLFDDTKAGIQQQEEWEAVITPLDAQFDPSAMIAVDYDARDLKAESPANPTFRLPDAPIGDPAWFKSASKSIVDHLLANRTLTLQQNTQLSMWSRVGESDAEFAARCDAAGSAKADAEAAKLTALLTSKKDRVNETIAQAQRAVDEKKSAAKSSRAHELIAGAGDLLSALLGGRKSARSIARSAGSIASRRGQSTAKAERVETAEERLTAKMGELEALETQLHDEVFAIDAKWHDVGQAITTVPITLERSDITVKELALVWIPV